MLHYFLCAERPGFNSLPRGAAYLAKTQDIVVAYPQLIPSLYTLYPQFNQRQIALKRSCRAPYFFQPVLKHLRTKFVRR